MSRHLLAGVVAATTTLALLTPLGAAEARPGLHGNPPVTTVQLLSFNDFHGHLEATDGPLSTTQDPSQTPVGGAEQLAAEIDRLRTPRSLTVAAGDLIGGSPALSGRFHDEPAVDSLNALGLDVSSVGNHEFDEGTEELLRMQHGGCHPVEGCYLPKPYAGADFQWLAANVVKKDGSGTLLPGTSVKKIAGIKVGFIGMTLQATPLLVSPGGLTSVDFRDEVATADEQARLLKEKGVEAIVVLLHEGGSQTGTYNGCAGISGPIARIAATMTPEVDQIISGHTHESYVCSLPDPAGHDRLVTSATSYGRAVTETRLVIDRRSGEVVRERSTARNHLVTRDATDRRQSRIIAKWQARFEAASTKSTTSESGSDSGSDFGSDSGGTLAESSDDPGRRPPLADLLARVLLATSDLLGSR